MPITKINNKNYEGIVMIEKTAVVISTNQGHAWIKSDDFASCGSCSSSGSCSSGASLFTSSDKERGKMQVANPLHAKPGDQVVIGLPSDSLLKSSLLAYLLPLISLLVFSLLGSEVFAWVGANAELGAVLMGIAGLFVGLRFSDTLVQCSDIKEKLQPVILRKHSPTNEHVVDFMTPTV